MKCGLFLGCNMPAHRPDVERAIRLTMPRLGVELEDLPGYVCCPAFGTFPSLDEEAHLAVSGWNFSLGEERGIDLLVECGSCYSSLRTSKHLLQKHPEKKKRINELLAKAGKQYQGTATSRHLSDVLFHEVGPATIQQSLVKSLEGTRAVIQYPCHTLFPSEIVGFEASSTKPQALAKLTEALGVTVEHYSLEYQCCGGAGGFHRSSRAQAEQFAKDKLDAIKNETQADFIVVSCITCLMHLDNVQKDFNKENGEYALPVFDYNQILALCMGFSPNEVAAISTISREKITAKF
jgi:heterodisulfide reductase subunit B